MTSAYEQSAQRAAVEAVERRWAREEAAARKAERGKRLQSCLAMLMLLVIVAGGAVFALYHFGGVDVSSLYPKKFIDSLLTGMSEGTSGRIDIFVDAMARFEGKEINPWKTVPDEMKPKRAKSGVRYTVMTEKTGGCCGLYEMTADGKGGMAVVEYSPISKPIAVMMADFKKNKVGKVYLIECGGKVYVCGSDNADDGRDLLKRLTR